MKYGRRLPYPFVQRPRVRLSTALAPAAVTVPPVIDELSKVTDWPLYANDRIGDCTVAAAGHMIQAWTAYGQGAPVEIGYPDVITAYAAVSGYDPTTGANDNGAVMQDVLDYWRNVGIGGHKILAFAEVDVHNPGEVALALYLFGHVYVGLKVPKSAEDQFAAGQPWDAVPDDGGIQGGHAVDLGYRNVQDTAALAVVTWGKVQFATQAFWDRYVDEAWVVADQEWITQAGQAPVAGLDLAALNAQFTALTREPGPFPTNLTPPSNTPADDALAAVALPWVREHHSRFNGNRHMANALLDWLNAQGYG